MHNLICIVCPRGCHIQVDENNNVSGNFCPRGKIYALNEITHPTRTITSTITVEEGEIARVPCVTSSPIPKENIFDVMDVIHKTKVKAPIEIGQVLISNILGLGIDIIASRSIERK
ncbi:MAG: DUF1667 domain-containing protein [Bacilli bacterium]